MSEQARRFEPQPSDDTQPFWDATRRGELALPWCVDCNQPFWYPRAMCPNCFGSTIEWRTASGNGAVYAVSVQYKPGPMRDADDGPYPVALVDLDEGVRVMANVLNTDPETVTVGMPVRATWVPLSDGRQLLQFEPR